MTFTCKKFTVIDDNSALKIGTDGMLLGAWVTNKTCSKNILDIGCGSGLISLMVAQRFSEPNIVGIDIHRGSIKDAQENALNSDWEKRLNFKEIDLKIYSPNNKFDLIISNPPFFENSTKNVLKESKNARHTDSLSFREIILFAKQYLNKMGSVALILPTKEAHEAITFAENSGFFLSRISYVSAFKNTDPNRVLFQLTLCKPNLLIKENFSIRIKKGRNEYADEYKDLLKDFLIIF